MLVALLGAFGQIQRQRRLSRMEEMRHAQHLLTYLARDHFRGLFHSAERPMAPTAPPERVHVERDPAGMTFIVTLDYPGDLHSRFEISDHDLRSVDPHHLADLHALRSIWSEVYDDFEIDRRLRHLRESFIQFLRTTNDPAAMRSAHEAMQHEEQRIRESHYRRREPMVVGVDPGRGEEITAFHRNREVSARGNELRIGPQMTATEVRAREAELLARSHGLTAAQMRTFAAEFARQVDRQFAEAVGLAPANPEAAKRGLELLKEHLSPEQRKEFDKDKSFIVTGSDSGKRYRIRYGRQMNIDEIDKNGNSPHGWCFLPEGGLCEGDTMLAQKIALENFEKDALKIANKIRSRGPFEHAIVELGSPVRRRGWLGAINDVLAT